METEPRFYVSWICQWGEYSVRDSQNRNKEGQHSIIDVAGSPHKERAQRACDRLNKGLDFDVFGIES